MDNFLLCFCYSELVSLAKVKDWQDQEHYHPKILYTSFKKKKQLTTDISGKEG